MSGHYFSRMLSVRPKIKFIAKDGAPWVILNSPVLFFLFFYPFLNFCGRVRILARKLWRMSAANNGRPEIVSAREAFSLSYFF